MAELTDEEIHGVLANRRRRLTLEFLRERDDVMTVRELSELIAEAESGESPPPRNVRQSAYVSLHQTHLPKLDDLGVLDYDEQSKEIVLRETADELAAYLEVGDRTDEPRYVGYLVAGILGLALVAGAELGLPVVAAVPPTGWAYLLFTSIALLASIQTVRLRAGTPDWSRHRKT